MSLEPPMIRQSIATLRPVFARYQAAKPRANSYRIASLCGVMMTTVSSVRSVTARFGRNTKGSATIATSVTRIRRRFTAYSVNTITSSGSALANTSPRADWSMNSRRRTARW